MTAPASQLTRARLGEVLGRFAGQRVGVVGDLGLDIYWYADMTRAVLSRETPHFPRPVVREAFSGGAGANVAHNLARLGVGEVRVFSLLGDDWRADLLAGVLAGAGIRVDGLIRSATRSTLAYIKPILMGYDSRQEDARLDFISDQPPTPTQEDALIAAVTDALPGLEALLVADQLEENGVITGRVRAALNALAGAHPGKLFVVDSRQRIGLFRNMILKPNRLEALRACCPERDPDALAPDDLAQVVRGLAAQAGRPVFMTLSEQGVLICAGEEVRHLPAAPVTPPLDPVGAGDTFVAALAAALAAGASPWEAGTLANLAAAVILEKLNQTGTASPTEILARYDLMHPEETPHD